MSNSRKKIPCLDPARCGVKWHWSDSNPPCATTSARVDARQSISELHPKASKSPHPTLFKGRPYTLQFNDEQWEDFSKSAESIHGLQVNRHALVDVVERITGGTLDVREISEQPDASLAFEVLCLDEGARNAVARAVLGKEAAENKEAVSTVSSSLEELLADARGTGTSDAGGMTEKSFPYTRQRIAGVLDAAFEAQRKKHAFEGMKKDLTKEMYENHPDRIGGKWTVRGNEVLPYDAANERAGDVILHMGQRTGSFDPALAKEHMSPEEWQSALSSVATEDIAVTAAELRKAAKENDIKIDAFIETDTTKVRVMVTSSDESKEREMDSSTKAEGLKEWAAGRDTYGSRFYVPDTSEMGEEQAFATLARARARADRNASEAHEVAQAIHGGIRGIESVALNQTIRYDDTDRNYTFQVNKTERFNTEEFKGMYPEVHRAIQQGKKDDGKYKPSQDAVKSVLEATRSKKEASATITNSRKAPASTPRFDVVEYTNEGYVKVKPSEEGKARAERRISRGEALNGRILTESDFCSSAS